MAKRTYDNVVDVDQETLDAEVIAAGLPGDGSILEPDDGKLHVITTADLDPTQEAALDAVVAAHDTLAGRKRKKIKQIHLRTPAVVARDGFEFPPGSGHVYSLELASVVNILGLDHIKDIPGITFPLHYSTKDGLNEVELSSPAEVRQFFLAALGAYMAKNEEARLLAAQVRDAATDEDIDAVEDGR